MNTMRFVYTKDRPHYSGLKLRRMSRAERDNALESLRIARANAVYEYLCSQSDGDWMFLSYNQIKEAVCTTKTHAMEAVHTLEMEHKIEVIHGTGRRANQYLIV